MEAAVSVRNLSKTFTRAKALEEVSFDVPKGSLFGLLGPNGAGKTTLFSVAAGFLRPLAGTVEVLGIDVAEISRLRGRFSMLPQDAAFQGGIPVVEQLCMFGRLSGASTVDATDQALKALELVGLADIARKNARALSHGMMKRVALCQAFMGEPEVIFLDEPTAGLDPENARSIREVIRGFGADRTVVLSSHNLQEIQDVCDHAAILNHGKLEVCAPMEQLISAAFLLRIELGSPLTDAAERALGALPTVAKVERTSERELNLSLNLDSPDQKDAVIRSVIETLMIGHDLVPRSLREGASLETRFLELTGGTYDGASGT